MILISFIQNQRARRILKRKHRAADRLNQTTRTTKTTEQAQNICHLFSHVFTFELHVKETKFWINSAVKNSQQLINCMYGKL